MNELTHGEVGLPPGHTASSLFHAVLVKAAEHYRSTFAEVRIPGDASVFKRNYGAVLARFEAARARAPERVEIARFLVRRTQEALRFGTAENSLPLDEYLGEQTKAPRLEHTQFSRPAGLRVQIPVDGRIYRDADAVTAANQLYEQHHLSYQAHAALRWVAEYAADHGGRIDLTGKRFVLLGAGAELSCARLLLEAGASVLWVDLSVPGASLPDARRLAGHLVRAPKATDLLRNPREIAAAMRAFAADGPVHVGMFAYAPGASKEWRLTAAMNAIVRSLEPGIVSSVSLLISPTTPSVLSAETVFLAVQRHQQAKGWQRALSRLGAITHPGHHREGDTHVSLSTVSMQGLSYQAAQYISKVAAAESYAVFGTAEDDEPPRPLTVSANVAGVTRTRSLSHPLFNAAFLGAGKFGVRIFEPATTRALSGLLMLHDLLNPRAPGAAASQHVDPREKATGLLAQQVHGGVYGLPFVLEGVIRAAAVVGMASDPSVLLKKSPHPVNTASLAGAPAE